MPFINCEIHLLLTYPTNCVIVSAAGETKFAITAKSYLPIITLSTQDNTKLLKKLKPAFKRTVNFNKYQSKVSTERKTKAKFRFLK